MSSTHAHRAQPGRPSRLGSVLCAEGTPRSIARVVGAGLAGGLALAGAGYLAGHDPHTSAVLPACPLYAATGLYCPGCGGTRAAYDLLHGRLLDAAHENLLVPLGLVLVAAPALGWCAHHVAARVATRRVGHGQPDHRAVRTLARRPLDVPRWVAYAVPAFMLVFTIVRNLPGGAFLTPWVGA